MSNEPNPIQDDRCQRHHVTIQPAEYQGEISLEIVDCQKTLKAQKKVETSPMTLMCGKSELKFKLQVKLDDKEENIGVFLTSLNDVWLRIDRRYEALTESGTRLAFRRNCSVYDSKNPSFGYRAFLPTTDLEPSTASAEVSPGVRGSVTFVCNFTVTVYEEEVSSPQVGTGAAEVVRAMAKLLKDGLLSDVTIACGDSLFKCHRAILAARSKYFETMFSGGMAESNQNSVTLSDVGAKTFELLLHYIYTGSVSQSADLLSTELLILADRFLLEDLKSKCEVAIAKTVDKSNAVELLSMAHTYSAQHLQTAAARFVMSNRQDLVKTRQWEDMVRTNPGALVALFKE